MKLRGTNIYMIRGDTEMIEVACQDSEGVAVPLVDGDKVYFTVKRNVRETAKALQKVVTVFQDGKASIYIHPEDTKGLDVRAYVYDIQLTRENGSVKTIVPMSKFVLEPEVTHE